MPNRPIIYEIDTRTWLRELSLLQNKPITFDNIPPQEWLKIRNFGCNWVWLMGVWQKSIISEHIARTHPDLRVDYGQVLPIWGNEDVAGSPYAVKAYDLNFELGNTRSLKHLREVLHHYGMKLILDVVPNHTACDHSWVIEHPDYYIQQKESNPKTNFEVNGKYLAYGKDPNYAPWSDTAQLNYFNPATRKAMIGEIVKVAGLCDGIRFDMAMLINSEIFALTWKQELAQDNWSMLKQEFFTEALSQTISTYPNSISIAEVYWGQEEYLQQLGFNYTYDKALYDLFLHGNATELINYLRNQKDPDKWLRFIENHDEQRAYVMLGEAKSKVAQLICTTLPGGNLIYQGQENGFEAKKPVQLTRRPIEPYKLNLEKLYRKLGKISTEIPFDSEWSMLDVFGWADNSSSKNIIAYQWERDRERAIIVVNYSDRQSQGKVAIKLDAEIGNVRLRDMLNNKDYEYPVEKLKTEGLFVDLAPWQGHIFLSAKFNP